MKNNIMSTSSILPTFLSFLSGRGNVQPSDNIDTDFSFRYEYDETEDFEQDFRIFIDEFSSYLKNSTGRRMDFDAEPREEGYIFVSARIREN